MEYMDDRKQAAAIAAVMAYIKEEEDIACAMAMQMQPSLPPSTPPPHKPWGLNGRQAQMQLRSLMQLKAFHSAKF
jgi:hypothetical protein